MTDFDVVVGHGAGTLAAIQGGGAGGTKSAPQTPARARLAALNAAVATGRSTLRTSAPVGAGTSGFSGAFSDTALIEAKIVEEKARRAKTDAIDGETLLRTLLAWQRGEPRVCAMVVPPTPEQEDRRRTSRERAVLLQERVRHVNRIKGLLAGQGITDYEPLQKDRRARLAALKTGDGQPLPMRFKAELLREIELIELLIRQIAEVELERDTVELDAEGNQSPVARLKAIGPQIAAVLYLEGLYRSFANRREVAAYAGLVPTPWRSGTIDREQGISKAGNRRLRHIMIELAWLWVRHQPGHGEVPEGAVLKAA